MKRTKSGLLATALIVSGVGLGVAKTGGSPGGYSSAPGEGNCTSCHGSFALDSGPNSFDLTAPGTSVGLSSLPIQLAFGAGGAPKYGFELAAVDAGGGTLSTWLLTDPAVTQTVGGNVTHTGTGTGQSNWALELDASGGLPAGPVTLYACGLEGNGSGTSGDYVYTAQATVYQAELSSALSIWPLGTVQPLDLAAPTRPNDGYVIAMSDGTTPTPLPSGLVVPVNLSSPLVSVGITTPAFFQGFVGALDGAGLAQAQVTLPPLPILSGFTLHFAFAAVDPSTGQATEVSNRVTAVLQ